MRTFGRILIIIPLVIMVALSAALSEGEFRPLPIDLTGGAPYNAKFSRAQLVYEDPTIRVERIPERHSELNKDMYYAVDIQIKDPSQIRTAAGMAAKKGLPDRNSFSAISSGVPYAERLPDSSTAA